MVDFLAVGGRFQWNVSKNVGPRQPNLLDDVELVRFGYFCFQFVNNSPIAGKMKSELQRMNSKGPFGEDLARVIVAHQKLKGGTQDGIVSVQRPTANSSYDGHSQWILTALNSAMIVAEPSYPDIAFNIDSGNAVAESVRFILRGQLEFQ